jgi:hypothetical protein
MGIEYNSLQFFGADFEFYELDLTNLFSLVTPKFETNREEEESRNRDDKHSKDLTSILPNDVICIIRDFLNVKDLVSCSEVSYRWYNAFNCRKWNKVQRISQKRIIVTYHNQGTVFEMLDEFLDENFSEFECMETTPYYDSNVAHHVINFYIPFPKIKQKEEMTKFFQEIDEKVENRYI